MPVAYLEKVVVFDQDLYHKHGMAGIWMGKIVRRFEAEAKHYAPKRTGLLAALIEGDYNQVGIRQVEGTIASDAPYSMFVLAGTDGPITRFGGSIPSKSEAYTRQALYRRTDGTWTWDPIPGARKRMVNRPNPGFFLKVPAGGPGSNPGGRYRAGRWKTRYLLSVAGQPANNFLFKAWRATARDHTAIRGIGVPTSIQF